ncbi:MAG: AMP-binding protein, partial [Bacteroidales bacterium]
LSFLTGTLAKRGEKIKHISRIVSGGDKLATSLDARCCEYLRTGVLEGYGLTECSPIVAFNSSVEKRKLGTVGPLFPSLKMEIRDRAGRLKDKQEEGVLWIKGPSVVKSYFRDEANTKERFKNGWFNTGDVVRIDSDGYIEIIDRATDIIIVGGFNVFPKEVETVLCKHPAVKSAVVVGEKNSLAGEIVKAFIILNDDAKIQPKELIDYSKKTLAHYKVPRKIAFVSEYPLSPAGKILRRVLRVTKI